MLFQLFGRRALAPTKQSAAIRTQVRTIAQRLVVRVGGQDSVKMVLCPTVQGTRRDNGAVPMIVAWGEVGSFVYFI